MADASNTLAGLITINDRNVTGWEFEEYLYFSPLVQALPWFPASNGTQHKFVRGTTAAGSAFRAVNTGIANAAGNVELVTETLKFLDAGFHRDVAIARGAVGGVDAYLNRELARSVSSAFMSFEQQIINGTNSGALGFTGLVEYVTQHSDVVFDGTGAGGARFFMLYAGEDGVAGIMGEGGKFEVSEPVLQAIVTDVATGAAYDAYRVAANGYAGLQVASADTYGVVGMGYNFDGTSGHVLDDDAISEVYAAFSAQIQPRLNMIITNRAGLKQLQQSRTATNPTGAPAPFPTTWDGAGRPIPIYVTDALADDAAQLTTSTTTTTTSTTTTTTGG